MAQRVADRRDMEFVLYEQLGIESLFASEKFGDLDRKMCDMVIDEARRFALKEILPTYAEADREGARFAEGRVAAPACFRRVHRLFHEGEWTAMTESPEYGGQGLPHLLAQAASEYLMGSNYSFSVYGILAHGAGKMIELFGSEEQKGLFLKKLYTGEWAGTMLLTEPSAGSDLGALTTTAVKNGDGTYHLSGSKIFITNGDQDITENIIHPVLARVEGGPAGTKGISIFLVPKIWVNEDGSLGEPNDIVCTGIEEKMGLHGSPTCSMAMGSRGKCRGTLLGSENMGMRIMFEMMNKVRLDVGTQALTHASTAYLLALDYAKERRQGRLPGEGADTSQPIIRHPDVRRMLLTMKAYVEGMRSLLCFIAISFDRAECEEDEAARTRSEGLVALLTPVAKAYCSERGFDVCVEAMQVFGGYGYTREYPVEQIVRDCKIASIYEGANGIQAMDLMGRKLPMKGGAVFDGFIEEVRNAAGKAAKFSGLTEIAGRVEAAAEKLARTAKTLATRNAGGDLIRGLAFAHPFLDVMGDVTMAWMLLWRAETAAGSLADPGRKVSKKDAAHYSGQIKSAEFFIHTQLPATMGKMDAVAAGHDAAISIEDDAFGL